MNTEKKSVFRKMKNVSENKSLDLEETDGWMECESCGEVTQQMKYVKTRKVPCYQMDKVQVLVPLPQK